MFCSTGNHWIHYKCDKLSDEQVDIIEKTQSSDQEYTCTYHKSENKCDYEKSQPKGPTHNSQLTLPKIVHTHNDSSSCAEHILHDETDDLGCGICSLEVTDSDPICDNCNIMCHEQCSCQVSGLVYCNGCAATVKQLDNSSCITNIEESGEDATADGRNYVERESTVVLDEEMSTDPTTATAYSNCDKIVDAEPSKIAGEVNSVQTINIQGLGPDLNSKLSETGGSQKVSNRTKPNKKEVEEVDKLNVIAGKQKELKQLETKLKKKEDELNLKESKLWDSKNEKLRLESYIQKIESRNDELDQTVRMLRNKIKILEERTNPDFHERGASNEQTKSSDTMYSRNTDQLVLGVQEKVTQFVMNRVEQQLMFLENSCNMQFPTQQTQWA